MSSDHDDIGEGGEADNYEAGRGGQTAGATAAGSSSTTATPARKHGQTCDVCKARKVRCDHRERVLAAGRADEKPSSITCTVCAQHGLRCTFTPIAPRKRTGKRLMAIRKLQKDASSHESSDRGAAFAGAEATASTAAAQSQQQSSSPSHSRRSGSEDDEHDDAIDAIAAAAAGHPPLMPNEPDIWYGDEHEQGSESGPLLRPGSAFAERIRRQRGYALMPSTLPLDKTQKNLLGVRGLTRPLMDACARAYFLYTYPSHPILHVDVFCARYALFFTMLDENKGNAPSTSSMSESKEGREVTPLNILSVLAVACVGAALLAPPLTQAEQPTAKFRLQDRIGERFKQELQKRDVLARLSDEGEDVVEACMLISSSRISILHSKSDERITGWDEMLSRAPAAPSSSSAVDGLLDPFRFNPSDTNALVRLVLALGLNRRPKPRVNVEEGDARSWVSSADVAITDTEVFRRARLFWIAVVLDSFRAMATQQSILIGDNDHDMDLPRSVPRPDGLYSTYWYADQRQENTRGSDGNVRRQRYDDAGGIDRNSTLRSRVLQQPTQAGRVDALQVEMMLRLTYIVRTVSVRFVSPRAQGRGVLITDVERATSSLTGWWTQLPRDVMWEVQSHSVLRRGVKSGSGISNTDEKSDRIAFRNSLKAALVEMLYHGNVLAMWTSVAKFGIRFDVDLTEAVHLFATSMNLQESGSIPSSSAKATGYEQAAAEAEERKQRAQAELDRLVAFSMSRVAFVAKQAGQLNIVRWSRNAVQNILCSYALWGCDLAVRIARAGTPLGMQVPQGQHPAIFTLACVQDILDAMATIDTVEEAPVVVRHITALMQQCSGTVHSIVGSVAPAAMAVAAVAENGSFAASLSSHEQDAMWAQQQLQNVHPYGAHSSTDLPPTAGSSALAYSDSTGGGRQQHQHVAAAAYVDFDHVDARRYYSPADAMTFGYDRTFTAAQKPPPPVLRQHQQDGTPEQAVLQAVGLDTEWDHMMENSGDAHVWVQSLWQGIHFPLPPPQPQ